MTTQTDSAISATVRRREREREARKRAILQAAGRVFARKGYYEATLDEIAADAELAKGTLYNYYRDKQDLFLSLVRTGCAGYEARIAAAADETGALAPFLQRFIDSSLDWLAENRYLFQAVFASGSELFGVVGGELLGDCHGRSRRAEELITAALRRFPDTRGLPEAERVTGARLILAAIRHLAMSRLCDSQTPVPAAEKDRLVVMLCRALMNPEAA